MDANEIGVAAGQVWAYLNEHGESSRTQIKKGLGGTDDILLAAAIGWLAREDKLAFIPAGRSFNIALKQ